MLHLCEDPGVVGTPFYVMEWVEGRVIPDTSLPNLSPGDRAALYDHLVRVLAALHRIDPADVGLGDFGRPGNYYARQISRWSRQYEASRTDDIPEMDALMDWLPANVPDSDASGIVHGDYRVGNCVIHGRHRGSREASLCSGCGSQSLLVWVSPHGHHTAGRQVGRYRNRSSQT
jgi:aminoglycoside phosphotransferase (APT) family kinase protein